MAATDLNKEGSGRTNDCKRKEGEKKQLEEHLVTNYVKWQQFSKRTGYKKNILEAESLIACSGCTSPLDLWLLDMSTSDLEVSKDDGWMNLSKVKMDRGSPVCV